MSLGGLMGLFLYLEIKTGRGGEWGLENIVWDRVMAGGDLLWKNICAFHRFERLIA